MINFNFEVTKLIHEEIAEIAEKNGKPVEVIAANYNGMRWAFENGYDKDKLAEIIKEKCSNNKKKEKPCYEKHTRAEWEEAMELWQLMKKLNKLVK